MKKALDFFGGDELRARIFWEKYALRDEKGNVLEETPEDMWRRILVALGLNDNPDFWWLLSDFRFVPGGRILHAVGNEFQKCTCYNCFPAGTKVLTRDGLKPIEAVRAGDEVLTHRNRFRKVTHVIAREINEPLCELRLWYLNGAPIRCTQDHLFLCLEGEQVKWVPAAAITPKHYIKLGRIDEDLPIAELDIAQFVGHLPIQEYEDGWLFTAVPCVGGNGAVRVAQSRRVRRKIRIDERFGLWLGYFIAEGGVTEHSVYFTFGKDEPNYAQEVATLTEELFGVSASIQWREGQEGNWLRVWVNSNLLAAFLRQFFPDGVHAHEKRLPSWFLMAPKSVQRAFIAGLFRGDGHKDKSGYVLSLANPDLMRQVWLILLRLGVLASLRWETLYPYTKHPAMRLDTHSRPFVDALRRWISGDFDFEVPLTETPMNYFYRVKDGEVFAKVKSVRLTERRQEVVYDLTVEDDHSFTAEFACAHNCYFIPIKEDSIEAIYECAKEMARTYSYGGGVGVDISPLRPAGAAVRNTARYSTGAVSFMELYSLTTGTIGQHFRRGALMITIEDWHPDVLDFVKIKRNLTNVRYANISVKISDEFMEAVKRGRKWWLRFEGEGFKVEKKIEARELMDEIVQSAWACVPYDTLLFVWKNGERRLMRIGDLVKEWQTDPEAKYEVLSLNLETLQLERKPITKVYEFTNDKKIYRAETESGKVFIATEDHIVYRLSPEGSIESVPISALRPGDFIVIAKTLGKDEKEDEQVMWIDLRDYWHTIAASAQGHGLEGEPIFKLLQMPRVRQALGKFPSGRTWRADEYLRVGYLPVKEAVRLRAQGVEIPADGVFWKPSRRHDLQLPLRFPIDETFAEFLGLWLAEGSVRKSGLRLDLHAEEAKELQPLLEEIARRFNAKWVWERRAGNWVGLRLDCTTLRLLLQILGIYQNGQKSVPSFIEKAPLPIIAAFLRGYFSGDGSIEEGGAISIVSVSRSILESVQRLLLLLGIHSRLGLAQRGKEKVINGKVCRARDTYRLTIYQGYNALFAQRVGFLTRHKQERLERHTITAASKLVGVPMIVNFALFSRTLSRGIRERIAPATVSRRPPLLADPRIRFFLAADVQYEKIVGIRLAEKQEEKVYDITVADNHTFVLASGWIISNSAEPGIIYWSTMKRNSNSEYFHPLLGTNPCSEIGLPAYGACNLAAINLYKFVKNPFTEHAYFDFEEFKKAVRLGVRFLDAVIDYADIANKYPLEAQRETENRERRLGLGIMGLADMFFALGLRYDSEEAVEFAEKVFTVMRDTAYDESVNLAIEKGPFPAFDWEGYSQSEFIKRLPRQLKERIKKHGIRNVALLTVAPTGSIGTMAGVSTGIEPIFQVKYYRRSESLSQKEFEVFHPTVNDYFKVTGKKELPPHLVTAHEIDPIMRVEMQATIQAYVCNAISSTINMPHDISPKVVEDIYFEAWKRGCKGITVYREGSREDILRVEKEKAEPKRTRFARPASLNAEVFKYRTEAGNVYITISKDNEGKPREVFINIGKSGSTTAALGEALGRILSVSLQYDVPPQELIQQLRLIRSGSWERQPDGTVVFSIPDAVGRALAKACGEENNGNHLIIEEIRKEKTDETPQIDGMTCPECGGIMIRLGGCSACVSCSYTRCD